MVPDGSRKPMSRPTAMWFRVTRAKARKLQKTKAWAMPGRGRSLMTLAWQRTSQTKSQTRFAIGKRWKPGSLREWRTLLKTTPKRRQKSQAEARTRATRRDFSTMKKCGGSARVPNEGSRAKRADEADVLSQDMVSLRTPLLPL